MSPDVNKSKDWLRGLTTLATSVLEKLKSSVSSFLTLSATISAKCVVVVVVVVVYHKSKVRKEEVEKNRSNIRETFIRKETHLAFVSHDVRVHVILVSISLFRTVLRF